MSLERVKKLRHFKILSFNPTKQKNKNVDKFKAQSNYFPPIILSLLLREGEGSTRKKSSTATNGRLKHEKEYSYFYLIFRYIILKIPES